MLIQRAYKTEIKPNDKQITFFRRCLGASRFVYNWALADRIALFEQGKKTSQYTQCKKFNAVKDDVCPWIRKLPYIVVESSVANLDTAYKNFFRRVKQGKEKAGFPRFKKKGQQHSFQLKRGKITDTHIYFTGIGFVRLCQEWYIPTEAQKYGNYLTVSTQGGKWFVSVLVYEEVDKLETTGKVLGIDFGIKDIAILSTGKVFSNPKVLYDAEAKLKRLQRELARRNKGGENWQKTKAKLQQAYYKVTCIRKHILNEISSYVVYDLKPDVIVLEDLNVSGMVKNHHLAKAILDVGFYELRRQIEYKAEWAGIQVVFADRFFPSSKTCSRCGCVKSDLTLGDRVFVCPDCGFEIDRDLNAAINLQKLGTVV